MKMFSNIMLTYTSMVCTDRHKGTGYARLGYMFTVILGSFVSAKEATSSKKFPSRKKGKNLELPAHPLDAQASLSHLRPFAPPV